MNQALIKNILFGKLNPKKLALSLIAAKRHQQALLSFQQLIQTHQKLNRNKK